MAEIVQIHQGKQPPRRHYLKEWLEERRLSVPDLLDLLNDPERSMDFQVVDKSQPYRWLKGQMPGPFMHQRLADALEIRPEQLLRHPAEDWFAEFFRNRTPDELQRIRIVLENSFPR